MKATASKRGKAKFAPGKSGVLPDSYSLGKCKGAKRKLDAKGRVIPE